MLESLLIKRAEQNHPDFFATLEKLNLNTVQTTSFTEANRLIGQYSFDVIVYLGEGLAEALYNKEIILPPHLPILLIDSQHTLSKIKNLPVETLIDFLFLPASPDTIQHKLNFLVRIKKKCDDLQKYQNEVTTLRHQITELHKSVEGHNSFLDLMSRRDGLTGLYNRRHFNTVLKEVFKRATSEKSDLALLIVNIDYFSEINKSCGQDFGDFVLNELSARLTSSSRKDDICFRLSGEEFAVVMPSTPEHTAMDKAEELRLGSEQKSYDNGYYVRNITVSVGVATLKSHKPYSHEELVNMADQALFLAKSEGRNRCVPHQPMDKSSFGTSEQNFNILKDTVARILKKTKTSTMRSLQLLAQAIMEGKENDQIHQAQEYAELISQRMGLPSTIIETFKNAIILLSSIRYLMHNEVINKEGELTENEWEVITDFPYKLAQITELFDYFSGERTVLLHHGEKYDGTGYPEGLKGEEIPIGARIFSISSALAAMNSDRPYRRRLSPDEIIEELTRNAGKQFDPDLVLKLIDIIEENGILSVSPIALDDMKKKISNHLIE